jgi:PD-(D/E)XK nuclease superfamily
MVNKSGSPLFRVREKQGGQRKFRTGGLKGLKELTLASLPIAIRRLDLLVDDCLIVELKAVEKVLPIHKVAVA